MAWLTVNFKSDSLHMPVVMDVLMPQGHGNYKTLYLLHGAGGDHASWMLKSRIADYVEGKNIAVIMPSGNNKCYVNNKYGKAYGTFIAEELIQRTEQWFHVSRKKEDRYIAGMSMGGYGAFYAALTNPELYQCAFSYSGLLDIVERFTHPQGLDLVPVFGSKENLYTENADLHQLIHKMSGLFHENVENVTEFMIYCGLQDPRIHMSEQLYDQMKQSNYKVQYFTEPGAHNFEYWDRCIQHTIKQIEMDGKHRTGGDQTCQ